MVIPRFEIQMHGYDVVHVHGHYIILTVSRFVKALWSFLCAHLIPTNINKNYRPFFSVVCTLRSSDFVMFVYFSLFGKCCLMFVSDITLQIKKNTQKSEELQRATNAQDKT